MHLSPRVERPKDRQREFRLEEKHGDTFGASRTRPRFLYFALIPGDRIRSFIERVERIDEEIKALNEGKKEVLSEAKGEGFDVKVLKEILRLRKQERDERDEQHSLLDLYLKAMESAGSAQAKAA